MLQYFLHQSLCNTICFNSSHNWLYTVHVYELHTFIRICTTYVELPDGLPMGLAVGRKASNLRRIMNAVGCLLTQSERSEREVWFSSFIIACKHFIAQASN